MVVACPGRLIDLVQQKKLALNHISFLTLDEADQMLDMGFQPQLQKIVQKIPPVRQTVMFTATWPEAVQSIAQAYLRDPERVALDYQEGKHRCVASVRQRVQLCQSRRQKGQELISFLQSIEGPVIVFVNRKDALDGVYKAVSEANVRAVALYGDLKQDARERSLQAFRDGSCRVIVATDVASRGLDIPGVAAVVCYDISNEATHVHRIGRTGRAGARGDALTLVLQTSKIELEKLKGVLKLMKDAGQDADVTTERLEKLLKNTVPEGYVTVESSDESELETFDLPGPDWLPWYRRPLERSPETTSLPIPPNFDTSFDEVASVVSGTTYLHSLVEQLYGHAAAREIPHEICRKTVCYGHRMLTKDPNGQRVVARKVLKKPYRWMAFRQVSAAELQEEYGKHERHLENEDFVWHIVIYELARQGGRVQVATQFFRSNLGIVYDFVKDAFDRLEEDDPRMIATTLQDDNMRTLLRLYFETSDMVRPEFHHTMARLSLWPEGPLLHHCCEQNFAAWTFETALPVS